MMSRSYQTNSVDPFDMEESAVIVHPGESLHSDGLNMEGSDPDFDLAFDDSRIVSYEETIDEEDYREARQQHLFSFSSTDISSLEEYDEVQRKFDALTLTRKERADVRSKWRSGGEIEQVQEKIERWETCNNNERQLIAALANWLERLIDADLWHIRPCGPTKNLPICWGSPNSCPLCLMRSLRYYQQWYFLLPILEESASRLTTGAYALKDLYDNLTALEDGVSWWGRLDHWSIVAMPTLDGVYTVEPEDVQFGNRDEPPPRRHPRDIPDPPPQQILTQDLEEQISAAEARLKESKAEIETMDQLNIPPSLGPQREIR
ncbi:hypothetical protein EG329_012756 [Mollisiaceae sp. DMI_Dod_QoI]|nr:hypothetical protein EG329_012756 [Helotiales sp. DMI_Dod_QoI]